MNIRFVQERLDSVAGVPLSQARADLGAALIAAGRYGDAADQFAAALGEAPAPGQAEQAALKFMQAYALDHSGASNASLRLYLDAVRLDGPMIGDAAARLNALLTPRGADALGPWITGDWASAVGQSLDELADSSRQRAQLAVLLAHVHALRGEHAAAAQSLREAIAASDQDVAAMASDLRDWIATSLDDPAAGPRMQVLLAQLDLMLGHCEDALGRVDSALRAGLADSGDLLEQASAHRLRGQALAALDRKPEAARALLEAARRYSWREDWEQSEALLRQVTELDETVQEAWWLWANARYAAVLLSVGQDVTSVDEGAMLKALGIWENGARLGPPSADMSWAYQIAMAIYGALSKIDSLTAAGRLWMAAVLGERCLQLGADGRCWSELSSIYRSLGYSATAAELIWDADLARGLTRDGTWNAALVLWEKAVDLLYLGRYDQARIALDEIAKPEVDKTLLTPVLLSEVTGIVSMVSGDLTAARQILERSLADSQGNFEVLTHLATCCRRQGDLEAAKRYNDLILEQTAPGYPGAAARLGDRPDALMRAGRHEEAVPLLRALSDAYRADGVNTANADALLGLCLLALGQPDAAELLTRSAAGLTSAWHAAEVARELRGSGTAEAAALAAVFADRSDQIASRTADNQAAEDELGGLLQRHDLPAVARVASMAARARMWFETGDAGRAAGAYGDLLEEKDLYPEARNAYLLAVRTHVLSLLRGDRPREAADAVRQAMDKLTSVPAAGPDRGVALLAGLGSVAELRLGEHREAYRLMDTASSLLAREGDPEPAGTIGSLWRESVGSPAAAWEITDQAANSRSATPGDGASGPLGAAAAESWRFLDDYLGLTPKLDEDARKRGEEPVTVTLGTGLVGEQAGGGSETMLGHVSEIRVRIKASRGVILPAVHLLDDAGLAADEFEIRLSGLLVEKARAETFGQVADALETLAMASLAQFLGTEEVRALVRDWAREDDKENQLDSVLPDDLAWVRLGALARRLAAEGIPLNWTEIFAAIGAGELDLARFTAAAESLRQPLTRASAVGAGQEGS